MEKKQTIKTRMGNTLQFTESSMHKSALPKHKGGPQIHPTIIDIFERLKHKAIEDVMKFSFPDRASAERFRNMCTNYRDTRKLSVTISMGDETVYLYRRED